MLKDLQPVMPRDALAGTAACTFEVGGRPMKVKTFTGSETAKVDKRVNDWLAQFGIKPHHTNTAIGQFTVKAEDQLTGKPMNRRVAVIAISVWYEEQAETG
jgi:hypothetical protein